MSREYEKFLAELGIPEMNMHYLICSNEHGKAKLSGGIGSYVEEAQKIFTKGELGVFLVGKGILLPEKEILFENKFLTAGRFYDSAKVYSTDTSEILLESILVVQYLYPKLRIIEIQDVEGYGVRLSQGKRNDLICSRIKVQICAHGSKIQMENVLQEWLDPQFYEVLYKEKIGLENADRVMFPTKYINSLYRNAGYKIDDNRAVSLRLPYFFKKFPENKYQEIDTIIFYGKRSYVKGYDVFAELIGLLDIDEYMVKKIKRIIMIGPMFPEMEKQNNYLNSLKKRVEIFEISTYREEAINIIKKNHSRSICVLPYKSDNHPYSLLEIIETGCPFVISNTGGVSEMIPERHQKHLMSPLDCRQFAENVKHIIGLSIKDRYELFSSLFKEASTLQEHYNKLFEEKNRFIEYVEEGAALPKLTASVILYLSTEDESYNRTLLWALKNQTVVPDKLYVITDDIPASEKLVKEAIPALETELVEGKNLKKIRNEILKQVTSDVVIVIKPGDIPKNDFTGEYLSFMERNSNYSCVTTYAGEIEPDTDINDYTRVSVKNMPYGEWGMLDHIGVNYFGIESSAYNTQFLKSINGWDDYEIENDDMFTFFKIISSNGRIGVICRPLIIRIKGMSAKNLSGNFELEQKIASNYLGMDRFDSYRLAGLMRSSKLGNRNNVKEELSEIEKYFITVQTLLLNGKLYEAKDILDNIDEEILKKAEETTQKQLKSIKKKTNEIIKKIENTGNDKTDVSGSNPLVYCYNTYLQPSNTTERDN